MIATNAKQHDLLRQEAEVDSPGASAFLNA